VCEIVCGVYVVCVGVCALRACNEGYACAV